VKKIFVILCVIVSFGLCSQAFAIESLLIGETTGGTFNGVARYFASGAEEGTAYETQQQSQYFGSGTFPSVLIYQASSGALKREEQFTMSNGWLNTVSKVGTSTLVNFVDPNNEKVTHGNLTQSAAGVGNSLIGTGTVHALFSTSGGLVMKAETLGTFTNARVSFGAVQYVTTGYGPTGGGEGERFSSITGGFEEHFQFGGFTGKRTVGIPIGVQYSITFNPAVSLVPVTVP
jgi:hypothetical protein